MDYPIREFAMGGGILIALVAILHVVVSHFAVGGGLVMAVLETAAVKRNDRPLRDLVKRSSMILLLLSTVFGAISGVGIWFTIGVVHPAATSSLIHTFVWAWATEWTFFLLEVVTALAWVATWGKVSPRTHLLLIWLYAFAAFMSLVVIQGILGFMLTPGTFPKTFSFWDGFLNPTYLPGILFRTGACVLLGAAWMAFAALREPDRAARARLSRILGAAGALGLGLAGVGWFVWERALPESVQRLFLGEKPLLAALATGRSHTLRMFVAAAVLALVVLLLPPPPVVAGCDPRPPRRRRDPRRLREGPGGNPQAVRHRRADVLQRGSRLGDRPAEREGNPLEGRLGDEGAGRAHPSLWAKPSSAPSAPPATRGTAISESGRSPRPWTPTSPRCS